MRNLAVALAGLACLAGAARAQDSIAPETLHALKHATAFVKVEAKQLSASGSGFVIRSDGDRALLVTNHHVVEPTFEVEVPDMLPRPGFPGRFRGPRLILPPTRSPRSVLVRVKEAAVSVVFDSGTPAERSARAEVVAVDPEHDLAVLQVTGLKELPASLDLAQEVQPVETMPVFTFGFPFGQALATGKGDPAITVGKATVSSLRLDDKGELALVQIDGSLNPGNSGGPVVDGRGRLVGIAVATIKNATGIGLIIPAEQLRRTLQGRLGTPHLTIAEGKDGQFTVRVEVGLIDPLNRIRSAALDYLPADFVHGTPGPDETLGTLPECRKLPLKVEQQLATGELVVDSSQGKTLLTQVVCETEAGKSVKSRVDVQVLGRKPAPNVAAGPRPGGGDRQADNETRILGGGDAPFKDEAPAGGLLVGLEIGLGKFFDNDVVRAVRPIFRTAKGEEVLGQQHGTDTGRVVRVKARDGYAVGAITVKAGLTVDGLGVTFLRVKDGRLDPNDFYKSGWIGGPGGGGPDLLAGDGTPVVGIIGKGNAKDCTGLGLLLGGPVKPGRPNLVVVPRPAGGQQGNETKIMGGGDAAFRDEAPAGGLLIGLEIGLGKFVNNDVIHAVRPIFRTAKGEEVLGQQHGTDTSRVVRVKAKDGYAVGGITAKAGLTVDGLSVTFMRVKDGRLDPGDCYESDWVGGPGGWGPELLAGDGAPVVGIIGKGNAKDCTGLGLLLNRGP
jgi:S1-C subfamily serine protease